MNTFGIYCICQNEETFIRHCIEYGLSLKPDQFVFIDGGSTDKTLEIIREYPQIELYQNPMGIDFSVQRNFALSRMKTDWVLHIDADENYAGLYKSRIDFLMNISDDVLGYSFPTAHLCVKQTDVDPHVRFFRNLPNLKYRKETCEWLYYDDEELPAHPCAMKLVKGKRVIYNPDIFLIHWAYRKSPTQLRAKSENYMKFNQSHGIEIINKNQLIGDMNVIYVLRDTTRSGGAKIVFEHCNRLHDRGWNVRVFALQGQPTWFELKVPVTKFNNFLDLSKQLSKEDVIKIATWWETASVVTQSLNGNRGFYFIQDIESSYYGNEQMKNRILSSYDFPLIPICEAKWVEKELIDLGKQPENISISIDKNIYHKNDIMRNPKQILYIDRSEPLKNRRFFEQVINSQSLSDFVFVTVGLDQVRNYSHKNHVHIRDITDEKLCELYNTSSCFLLTSSHEGFGLPALEAMNCGCPVICTRADGNEEFCINEKTALLADNPEDMIFKIIKIHLDKELWSKLSNNDMEMARNYDWDKTIDKLETVLKKY